MKALHSRLVAAIRYDYEVGLESQAAIAQKYRQVAGFSTVLNICARRIHPDVEPIKHATAWAKLSWGTRKAA